MLGINSTVIAAVAGVAASLLVWAASSWQAKLAEGASPPIGNFVETSLGRVHLMDMGPNDPRGAPLPDNPPIVLIHGASVNLRDMLIALGEELVRTHRVILIDRAGRGYSDRPRDGHVLDVQAQQIHEALNAIGVARPVVVGQSLGGAVALSYALQYQEDISGLVLLAPVSHEWPGGVAWYNGASNVPVVGTILRRVLIPIYGRFVSRGSVAESFAPNTPPEDYYERAGVSLLFRPGDFKANAADLYRLKPQIISMQGGYGALELPTVIAVGDADTTVSPEIHAKTLVQQMPNAKLVVFPGVGHALHHARSAEICETIRALASEEPAL
ncbi:MAG: alpha/beta hydrolase [Pseudomonadota bacterium]